MQEPEPKKSQTELACIALVIGLAALAFYMILEGIAFIFNQIYSNI